MSQGVNVNSAVVFIDLVHSGGNQVAIENTRYWCLDVPFREDQNRLRNRVTANNLAWLKHFALSRLKLQTDKYTEFMSKVYQGKDQGNSAAAETVDFKTRVIRGSGSPLGSVRWLYCQAIVSATLGFLPTACRRPSCLR